MTESALHLSDHYLGTLFYVGFLEMLFSVGLVASYL